MNRVEAIIKEEFDERVALMALAYTLGQLGMDNASEITDDEIEAMEGNPMMSKEFVQSLAKCARRIGKVLYRTSWKIFSILRKENVNERL